MHIFSMRLNRVSCCASSTADWSHYVLKKGKNKKKWKFHKTTMSRRRRWLQQLLLSNCCCGMRRQRGGWALGGTTRSRHPEVMPVNRINETTKAQIHTHTHTHTHLPPHKICESIRLPPASCWLSRVSSSDVKESRLHPGFSSTSRLLVSHINKDFFLLSPLQLGKMIFTGAKKYRMDGSWVLARVWWLCSVAIMFINPINAWFGKSFPQCDSFSFASSCFGSDLCSDEADYVVRVCVCLR